MNNNKVENVKVHQCSSQSASSAPLISRLISMHHDHSKSWDVLVMRNVSLNNNQKGYRARIAARARPPPHRFRFSGWFSLAAPPLGTQTHVARRYETSRKFKI
jgi:hypothetical protein